jgi:hypothetical protein
MRRALRYLRIVFSVACAITCVLLIALWIRSYRWIDSLDVAAQSPVEGSFRLASVCGRTTFEGAFTPSGSDSSIEYSRIPTDPNMQYLGIAPILLHFKSQPTRCLVSLPNWLSILLISSLGSAVWLPWRLRFSLRTLLIATTLVAIGLGFVVYALK